MRVLVRLENRRHQLQQWLRGSLRAALQVMAAVVFLPAVYIRMFVANPSAPPLFPRPDVLGGLVAQLHMHARAMQLRSGAATSYVAVMMKDGGTCESG